MLSKNISVRILNCVLLLVLSSCKSPVAFTESFSSKTSSDETTSEDTSGETEGSDESTEPVDSDTEEIVADICDQMNADTHNAAQGDIFKDPLLTLSFVSDRNLLLPQGPCVNKRVIENSELRREIRYEYFCRDIKGVVNFISTREEEKGVVISVIDTDVDVWNPHGVRHVQSVSTHSQFENGASQVDREFEESVTRDGVEHRITGVSFYDFIPDEEAASKGQGFVEISGSLSHQKGEVVESVYSLSSKGLHRAACGFDDGVIVLRSSSKVTTATYSGCGRPKVSQKGVEEVSGS